MPSSSSSADLQRHWALFGLPTTSSVEDIRKKYLELAVEGPYRHPDKGGTKEGFQHLQEAYAALRKELEERQVESAVAAHSRCRDDCHFGHFAPTSERTRWTTCTAEELRQKRMERREEFSWKQDCIARHYKEQLRQAEEDYQQHEHERRVGKKDMRPKEEFMEDYVKPVRAKWQNVLGQEDSHTTSGRSHKAPPSPSQSTSKSASPPMPRRKTSDIGSASAAPPPPPPTYPPDAPSPPSHKPTPRRTATPGRPPVHPATRPSRSSSVPRFATVYPRPPILRPQNFERQQPAAAAAVSGNAQPKDQHFVGGAGAEVGCAEGSCVEGGEGRGGNAVGEMLGSVARDVPSASAVPPYEFPRQTSEANIDSLSSESPANPPTGGSSEGKKIILVSKWDSDPKTLYDKNNLLLISVSKGDVDDPETLYDKNNLFLKRDDIHPDSKVWDVVQLVNAENTPHSFTVVGLDGQALPKAGEMTVSEAAHTQPMREGEMEVGRVYSLSVKSTTAGQYSSGSGTQETSTDQQDTPTDANGCRQQ
ncbi:unnamed protein product [Vitrella brassicaformis CCMP3155]|uniref:J domain-containing protein n=1 Tax=Vitrella brassicaformis (strain CCMP3155) TaxID=1169540 RepID=A0A0G4EGS3_VITBC|nr:unnamed protein product [Vitrella brassicaformis CCMP3155]|eukprot:CEL94673.1 unnamed protein product [Vitrella brassicaformis CCMP3155]